LKATLDIINQMQADGVICHYAIGGAVGVAYYSEPATTGELEVFVILPFNPEGSSASLAALHDYLLAHGTRAEDESFELGGWPVRFLVASNNLESEAVAGSLRVPINGGGTWVMMAEHMVAIALTTNRPSDRVWILRLAESDAIDELVLKSILTTHGSAHKWAEFEREYPPQSLTNNEMRREVAALSFSEKIKILEKLRDREKTIAASSLRKAAPKKERER
jgi:hypothetical protein